MNKEELKTFLLYLTVGAIIVLSINTFLQNQQLQAMQKQIDTLQQYILNNNKGIVENKNLLGNLSEEIQ